MSELVRVFKTIGDEEWLCFRPEAIEQACISECGCDGAGACWGEGPEDGDMTECVSLLVRLSEMDENAVYVPVENGGDDGGAS